MFFINYIFAMETKYILSWNGRITISTSFYIQLMCTYSEFNHASNKTCSVAGTNSMYKVGP